MRLLLFLLVFPALASAQTDKGYQDVMDKFVRYYNANQTDSICTLFPDETSKDPCFWRWANQKGSDSREEYGKILSYKYLGKITGGKLALFKFVSENKKTKAMSFDLDKKGKFGTFRFDTSDDEIDALLKKAKD